MSSHREQLRTLDPGLSPWRALALKWLDFPLGRFLDYGCGSCGLMKYVEAQCDECHGVDVNREAYLPAQAEHPDFQLSEIGQDGRTRYPDGYFDTIAIIEVIEHVPDEAVTLRELERLLKPGGRLLLTTPHRGLLTFMDIANFKFVFPRLHWFIHVVLMRNKKYYNERFEQTKDKKLAGDISVSEDRVPWHRHYKAHEIRSYCPDSLELEKSVAFFPGMRLMLFLRQVLRVLCLGKFKPFPWPLTWIERRLRRMETNTGDQLGMMFVKKQPHGEADPTTETGDTGQDAEA